jgi:hypothetical protein
MKILEDENFIKWLEKNNIDYKDKDKDYISALYSEYIIEIKTKKEE